MHETRMYETRNDLHPELRFKMIEMINARLADAIGLRIQMKVSHWNVKGPQFRPLHELFDDIASDVDKYVDLIAERAVQLGGVAEGTLGHVAERSTLEEYAIGGGAELMVPAVADALAHFGKSTRESIAIAMDSDDQDTADLFTEVSRGLDKWLWFVEAHLQGEDEMQASAHDGGEIVAHHP